MVEHTSDEWWVEMWECGCCARIEPKITYEVNGVCGVHPNHARQIVREHNAHSPLVDACKALDKVASDPDLMDCAHNCVPAHERGEKMPCEYWPCAHVELLAACVVARAALKLTREEVK